MRFSLFAAALALSFQLLGQTGNTTIQPDCLIPFTFTAAGSFPVTPTDNGAGDNRTKGCLAWTLMYHSVGLTGVTVTLQSGSSPTTSVSFGTFAGTIPAVPLGNVNPIVSDTGGSLQAINGTADISWVRVNVAATGTGTLTGVLYGFRLTPISTHPTPSITLVNHVSGCSGTTFTTSPINNTGATSLYCQVTSSNATPGVSDSSSNAWTGLTNASNSTSFATTKLFYVTNATVSAAQTFTVTAAGAAPSMICGSFSGTALSASFDQQNQTNDGTSSTINTGSVTPGSNGELILAGVGFDASLLFASISDNFTGLVDQQNFGACYGSSLAYKIQGTAATINPLWTMNIANHNQAKIATFK